MMFTSSLQIIDLSLPIQHKAIEPTRPRLKPVDHRRGASLLILEGLLSGRTALGAFQSLLLYLFGVRWITRRDFPDGLGLAWENVRTMSHRGTHLDAPWHFGPFCEGRPAKRIEDVPLQWCYGDGVVLDMSHKKAGEFIMARDIEKELERIHYKIRPFDIVLIKTGMDKLWNAREYLTDYPGMDREGVLWLMEQGVKVIGIDSYSLDRPARYMLRDYLMTRDKSVLWPAHMAGRDGEYCHLEKLANLGRLPSPYGFKVICFPVLLKGASAGWTRAVAMVEKRGSQECCYS